jgi:FkbM family methyltransferase
MKPFCYSDLFQPGDLVFDVGSHDGSGQAKCAYNAGARLVCYEPVPQFAEKIHLHCPNATVEVKGLLERAGKSVMSLSAASPQSSSFNPAWIQKWTDGRWNDRIECPITTLDLEIGKYGKPTYIAIDAECMDDRVIAGLSQRVKVLCFEYHPLPEFRNVYHSAVAELLRLCYHQYNYVTAAPLDQWQWELDEWVDAFDLLRELDREPKNPHKQLWGRVFARDIYD